MYTLEEIAALRALALSLSLEGADLLDFYTDTGLGKICNGIGPELFPDALRRAIDALHPTLKAPAMVHDVEYTRSDGSWETFCRANDRFRRNGKRCACARYGWYDPRRYIVIAQASRFAALCQAGGWIPYMQAREKALRKGCDL